jgi:head-tail adaptor
VTAPAAGDLDRRIRIEGCTKATSASGEITRSWPPLAGFVLAEVWAQQLQRTPRERFLTQQPVAELEAGWRIRWRRDLVDRISPSEDLRILDDGRVYDITGVVETGRREGLEIYGKARAES